MRLQGGRRGSRFQGGRRTTECGNNGVERFDPDEATLLAERAEVDGFAGELVKQSLPVGRRGGQQECSGSDMQQLAAAGEFVFAVAVGEKAEVADANEAGGQDVEQEAAEEFDGVESESFFGATVAVVFPAEADTPLFDLQQAMIGDSDAMSVAAEVVDDLGGAAEGALGVDDPALSAGGT